MANKSVACMLDSGASISAISQSLLNRLPRSCYTMSHTNTPTVFTASGQPLAISKMVQLNVNVKGLILPCTFYVSPMLSAGTHMIFGLDSLEKFQCTLDYFNGTVSFYDDMITISLRVNRQDNEMCAKIARNFTLQPNAESILAISVPRQVKGNAYVLEPSNYSHTNSFAVARALVCPRVGKVNCRVVNLTSRPVLLKRNTPVATLHRLTDEQITDFVHYENDHETVNALQYDFNVNEADQNMLDNILADMGIDLSRSCVTDSERLQLSRLIVKYADIFAKDMSQLSKTNCYSHKIDTGDSIPQRSRMYRYSPAQKEEIERQVTQMLENDIIFPSNSLWQAPVVLIAKRHTDTSKPPPPPRFAVDFRKLNTVTAALCQVSINFDSVADEIGSAKAKVFTALDFYSGFFQIPLADKESMERCSFQVPSGIYSFKVLPMGVRNGSIAFQSMVNSLFRKMLFRYMLCYTDDVIIYSPDMATHLSQHLPEIFAVLRKANLKLHSIKSQFATNSCRFLGNIITSEGFQPDPQKVAAIASFETCKNQTELRRWLGATNYFRRYVKNYSKITHCLTRLLQKDAKWVWNDEHTQAFETLRDRLINAPIMAFPDFTRPFHITTDASTVAIGYYLSFYDENNKERVVCYGGRNLHQNEKAWSTVELEALAIVEAIRQFSVYLSNSKFTIHSDNVSMQWLNSIKNANGRLLRWSLLLQSYNFDVIHKSGKLNPVADFLSRRTYPESDNHESPIFHGPIDENEIFTIGLGLDDEAKHNSNGAEARPSKRILQQVVFQYKNGEDDIEMDSMKDNNETATPNICLLTDRPDLATLQRQCIELGPIVAYLESNILPDEDTSARKIIFESERYILDNKTLYFLSSPRRRHADDATTIKLLAVPVTLRGLVLKSMHDANFGGSHCGLDRMFANIKQRFHWKNAWTDVYNYVTSCAQCQHAKRGSRRQKAPLIPIAPNKLFERWHIDFVQISTAKTDEQGRPQYNKLLVAVDSYSHWLEAIPVNNERAEDTAQILYEHVFCRYGAPKILVADRGKTFMSQLVKELCKKFEIEQHFTSSFHAQSNSVAERTHQNILNALRTYTTAETDWLKLLPGVLASLRAGVCTRSSEYSPYFLCFHREMRMPVQNILDPPKNTSAIIIENPSELNESIEITHQIAQENIKRQQEKYKETYDKNAAYPIYQVGDQVLLYSPAIPPRIRAKKLFQHYHGPYYIAASHPNFTFTLRECQSHKLHPSRVHANRLKMYTPPTRRLYNAESADLQDDKTTTTDRDRTTDRHSNDAHSQQSASISERQTDVAAKASDDREWYPVRKLLATRRKNSKREYKVDWVGDFSPSWVSAKDISPLLKQEFHIFQTQHRRRRRRKRHNY